MMKTYKISILLLLNLFIFAGCTKPDGEESNLEGTQLTCSGGPQGHGEAYGTVRIQTKANEPKAFAYLPCGSKPTQFSFEVLIAPKNGQVTKHPDLAGIAIYTPNPGFNGVDEFELKVLTDGEELKLKGKVLITSFSFGHCDGSLGRFDVFVIPDANRTGYYEISAIPFMLDSQRVFKISLENLKAETKVLLEQTKGSEGVEILVGYVTEEDLATFELLVFQDLNSEDDAFCGVPRPLVLRLLVQPKGLNVPR